MRGLTTGGLLSPLHGRYAVTRGMWPTWSWTPRTTGNGIWARQVATTSVWARRTKGSSAWTKRGVDVT